MKTRFTVFLLIFVPVLGLTSCSKDLKPDSWQMSEPTVEASGQPPLSVRAASRRILPGDSALKFSGDAWTSLNVASNCRYGGALFKSEATVGYRETLTLKSLWPAPLWKTFSTTELVASECDFSFTATNVNGSTQSFILDQVKLDSFQSTAFQSKIATFAAGSTNSPNQTAFTEAVRALSDDISDEGQITLKCGAASASMSLRAASRTTNPTQALMNQIGLQGRQMCRFIVAEANSGRDLSKYEVTGDVSMKFPAVTLVTSVDYPISNRISDGQDQKSFSKIAIRNPGTTSTFVKVDVPEQLSYKMIYRQSWTSGPIAAGQLYESDRIFRGPIAADINGATQITAAGSVRVFELKANETLQIEVKFADYDRISQILITSERSGNSGSFLGFRYGVNRPLYVIQSDAISFADPQTLFEIASPGVDVLPFSMVFQAFRSEFGDQIPAGFLPPADFHIFSP